MLQTETESPEINHARADNFVLDWGTIDTIAKALSSETDENRFNILTKRLFEALGEA